MKPKRPKNSTKRKKAIAAGYRSGLEHDIAKDLTARGIKFGFETTTIKYELAVPRGKCGECGGKQVTRTHFYTPDFVFANGKFLESKGRLTSKDRTKLVAVQKQTGPENLYLLLSADNWLTKKHTGKYSDWAKKHGFVYSVGTKVPASWCK